MKKILLVTAAAAGVFALPVLAIAQHQGGPPAEPRTRAELQKQLAGYFSKLDTNKDGAVTKAEFDVHHEAMRKQWAEKRAERQNERFAAMDADKNGQISKAEFTAYQAANADRRGEARKGPPEGGKAEGDKPMRGDGDGMRHHGMKMGAMGHRGGMGAKGGDMFAAVDANKDGKLTLAEFSAKPLAMFDKLDTNKDGSVTREEQRAAWDKMRAEKRESPERPATPPKK